MPGYSSQSRQQVPIGPLAQGLQSVSLRDQSSTYGMQATEQTPRTVSKHVRADSGQDIVTLQDPASQVRIAFIDGPPEQITDPVLLQRGISAQRSIISADNAERQHNFPGFQKRDQPRRFFTIGKVFMVLWVEPAGEWSTDEWTPGNSEGKYGQKVFSKVRRFVVIRESDAYCTALPITNYGGQGVGKRGVVKSEHTIIYTGKQVPAPMPSELPTRGEEGMRPQPIRVDLDDPQDGLDEKSRLNFGYVYTIQHSIKVRAFGKVHPNSTNALLHQFGNAWHISTTQNSPAASQRSSSAEEAAIQVQASSRSGPSATAQHGSGSIQSKSQAQAPSSSPSSGGRRSRSDAVQALARLSLCLSTGVQNHNDSSAEVLRVQAQEAVKRLVANGFSEGEAVAIVTNRLQTIIGESRDDNDSEDDSSGDDSDGE